MDLVVTAGAVYLFYRFLNQKRARVPILEDAEDKITRKRGKAQVTINRENIVTYLQPTYNPRKFESSKMMQQRVEARLYSMKPGITREAWKQKLVRNDLRGEVGGNTGIAGPLYYRWG
jgi:hypothetical protein